MADALTCNALDYESGADSRPFLTNPSQPHSSLSSNSSQPNPTYSSAAKAAPKITYPKKDQAIVFHTDDNSKLQDFVRAVSQKVGAKSITYASRISNNRICIYLSSSSIVDGLIKSHPTINVKNTQVPIRRLISPTKRIVISNVSPYIPHDYVERAIKSHGLQLSSPISFSKAGIPGDEFSHISSFRRQAYVHVNSERFELQTSSIISFENTEYRIFLSTDKMECFLCKQPGHIANSCPNPPTLSLSSQNENGFPSPDPQRLEQPIPAQDTQSHDDHPIVHKRGRSQVDSPSDVTSMPDKIPDLSNEDTAEMPPPKKPSTVDSSSKKPNKKKRKLETATEFSLPNQIKADIMQVYNVYPNALTLPKDNLFAFLENSHGSSNPHGEALKFTNNIRGLLQDMHLIYPHLSERSMKNRFTRISKKIKEQLADNLVETDSLSSVTPSTPLDTSDDECPSDSSQQPVSPSQ